MARPTRNVISQGLSSWDADVDANFGNLTNTPLPIVKYDTVGELPTASSYDRCPALVGTVLYISDGSVWAPYNGTSVYQADSTATLLADAVADFNTLLGNLQDAGIMATS